MTTEVVDPLTGEIVSVEHMATIYANAVEQERDLFDDLAELQAQKADYEDALRAVMTEEMRVDAGEGRKVVMVPPKRPPQRVSTRGCERHREVLLDLKMGRMEEVYRPPLISEVRERRAELVARGIPLVDISPEPMAGPPTIGVVKV